MFSGQLVCRTQSHSPGCVSRPFPFALGQIQVHLRPLGKKQTHALGEHEPPASTYRSQGKKAWLQPGCFRHSTAKACQSFQPAIPFFFDWLRIPSPLGSLLGFSLARTIAHPLGPNVHLVICFCVSIFHTIKHSWE